MTARPSPIDALLAEIDAPLRAEAPDPPALAAALASDLEIHRDTILAQAARDLPFTPADSAALFDDMRAYLDRFPDLVATADAELAMRSANVAAIDPGARMIARPHGRVLLVVPANAPMPLAVILPLSFACAGNRVIVAASSGSRGLSLALAAMVRRYVPDRVTLWPHGVKLAVDALLEREAIDALYFTGSSALRGTISGRAAEAGVTLIYEGQGMGAALIDGRLDGPGLDRAALHLAQSKARWMGQMCSSPNVLLIENDSRDRLRDAFDRAAAATPLPRPLGTLVDEQTRAHLASQASPEEASALDASRPALFSVPDLDSATQSEIFGPACFLLGHDDVGTALARLDALRHRLQLSIFSDDPAFIDRAIARTRLARYCVNRMPSVQNPLLPWGNFGKSGTSAVQTFFAKARVHAIVEEDRPVAAATTAAQVAEGAAEPVALAARCIIWAHPRSRSTAFERAFIERDDCVVLHEPLSKFPYFGGDIHALVAAMASDRGLVEDPLLADVRHGPDQPRYGIVKDFPYHALAYLTDDFLRRFRHIFLVRAPEATIRSFHAVHPDFRDDEAGYQELLALARRVRDRLGEDILVVEADELASRPETVLRRSCAFIGIPYRQTMVAWRQRDEIPAWGLWSRFHETALGSTSLRRAGGAGQEIDLPVARKRLAAELEPVYRDILGLSGEPSVDAARRSA